MAIRKTKRQMTMTTAEIAEVYANWPRREAPPETPEPTFAEQSEAVDREEARREPLPTPAPAPTKPTGHTSAELAFVRADDLLNIVRYRSASKSGARGPWNYTELDVLTGDIRCSCQAAACGRWCWHARAIADAWGAHPARVAAASLADDALRTVGPKLAHLCRVNRSRSWRCIPADQVTLVATRAEYYLRVRAERAAPVAATAVAA